MDIECRKKKKKSLTQGLSPSLKAKSQIIPDTVRQPYSGHLQVNPISAETFDFDYILPVLHSTLRCYDGASS